MRIYIDNNQQPLEGFSTVKSFRIELISKKRKKEREREKLFQIRSILIANPVGIHVRVQYMV